MWNNMNIVTCHSYLLTLHLKSRFLLQVSHYLILKILGETKVKFLISRDNTNKRNNLTGEK